jgi:predicted RNase H-like HicB family nuclease
MTKISISEDGDWNVITDKETGVTTQGKSKIEALLMLADALALHEEEDTDLMAMAESVFEQSEKRQGPVRETIIRFDPEGVAPPSMPERLRAHEEGASIDELDALPERRVFGVGNEEDYERISEAAWGVANAFVGSSLHTGHELVACPECGYEGSVDQAVFPGGTDHHSDAREEEE